MRLISTVGVSAAPIAAGHHDQPPSSQAYMAKEPRKGLEGCCRAARCRQRRTNVAVRDR